MVKNYINIGMLVIFFVQIGTHTLGAQRFPCADGNKEAKSNEVWMNVFVHGIMSIKPHISIFNFLRILNDKVEETVYIRTVEFMRKDPLFYENQAMQEFGLKKMDGNAVYPGNSCGAMELAFEAMSSYVNSNNPVNNRYYTFGWSGIMSYKMRYKAACELYGALVQEIAYLKGQGFNPKVRLIGYSHGGNVLLNLALVRQQEKNLSPLTIDQLVLFGMPVQSETDYLINDPIFSKIYHIYSRKDYVQTLDFFSLRRFFSRRTFGRRLDFELPNKLIQIELVYKIKKCNRHKKNWQDMVYDFETKTICGNRRSLQDASPGHSELWFFGWTPLNYRKSLPVYPLPAAAFTPLFLKEAACFEELPCCKRPTLIELRPEHGVMVVKNKETGCILALEKFMPEKLFEELKKKVMQYEPKNYTIERYNQAICDAYKIAYDMTMERLADVRRKRIEKMHDCCIEKRRIKKMKRDTKKEKQRKCVRKTRRSQWKKEQE